MSDSASDGHFATETEGLEEATQPEVIRLRDGDSHGITITPVRKRFGGADVRMLGYNGSIPGPTLLVDQDSEVTIEATNLGDVEATLHWHGLRLENQYDGVPDDTQAPILHGGSFTYKLTFPDAGFYWYHPHIREDFAQEMGLYAGIIVEPADPFYWPQVDRQLAITLDDVLIEDGQMAPFLRSGPTFTAMGRFGNVMLINGDTDYRAEAAVGEVVRLHLVNTANTRIFNFALRGARMKLIGGDSGRVEHEEFIDDILLSPSERAIVDVLFEEPGEVMLENRTPDRTYDLGRFVITGEATAEAAASFANLRTDPELAEEREHIEADLEREPDKTLAFVSQMPILYGNEAEEATSYVCPMHPEVTDSEASDCPKCGMRLIPATDPEPASEHEGGDAGHAQAHDHADGLEWEDLMPEINRRTDPSNMIWQLIDRDTGNENAAITWSFRVGDRVKIRLANEMDQEHPMHHPFHIHGAGRFLVLARDGERETNFVWKDTVLLRAGQTVDILLDVTNPGVWMAHCHIAEHTESGMMFTFDVAPAGDPEIAPVRAGASASDRLQAALEAQVKAGAPSALARLEAPKASLYCEGASGHLMRGEGRSVAAHDAFRIASTTKNVTSVVVVRLAAEGRIALDEPLEGQLAPDLLERWSAFSRLGEATPRQLIAHTAGLTNYFNEDAFFELLRQEPGRIWQPVELVDHAAAHGTPYFAPGQGFRYSDTGFVVAGLLAEQVTGKPLHKLYREFVFAPLAMDETWLEGREPDRRFEMAHHYTEGLDWTTISPTIDWAGGGLVTTVADLARFVRGLWSEEIVDSGGLAEITKWTPGASFPPGHTLRYERYGLGIGSDTVEGVELIGHTGFIGAFAFYAPDYDAVLVGTHNASEVDRRPLVAALCRELRRTA